MIREEQPKRMLRREGGGKIPNRMDLTEANRNAQPTLSRCIFGKMCKNQRDTSKLDEMSGGG